MNRVAKFYGISEEELNRRSGVLESNLQAYRDMLRAVMMAKIVDQPNHSKIEALEAGRLVVEAIDQSPDTTR